MQGHRAQQGAIGRERRRRRETQITDTGVQSAHRIAVRKHNSKAGTNHRFRPELVSQARARSEVLVVIVHRGGTVACSISTARELECTIDPGNVIGQLGIKEALGIVNFRDAGEEVITQAKIVGSGPGFRG